MSDAIWAEVLKLSQALITLQHAHNALAQRLEQVLNGELEAGRQRIEQLEREYAATRREGR